MNVVYGLYCVCERCPGRGIRYVGKTSKGVAERLKGHKAEARINDSNTSKSRWIRKHGEENIRVTVLDETRTEEELAPLEVQWIATCATFKSKNGLNQTEGGEGVTGHVHSPKTREQFRERTKRQFEQKHPRKILSDRDAAEIRARLWDGEIPRRIHEEYPQVTEAVILKLDSPTYRPGVPFPDRPRTLRQNERNKMREKTRSRYARGELKARIKELYATGEYSKSEIARKLEVSNAAVTRHTQGEVE